MRVLFLKAQIPDGGRTGDLLSTPVLVRGYTRKDGVVVPSHASTRNTKPDEATPAKPAELPPVIPAEAPSPPAPSGSRVSIEKGRKGHQSPYSNRHLSYDVWNATVDGKRLQGPVDGSFRTREDAELASAAVVIAAPEAPAKRMVSRDEHDAAIKADYHVRNDIDVILRYGEPKPGTKEAAKLARLRIKRAEFLALDRPAPRATYAFTPEGRAMQARVEAAIPPAEPPPPPVDLLSATDEDYARAIVDRAHAKLHAGGAVTIATYRLAMQLTKPEHADALRARGRYVELRRGQGWDAVMFSTLDHLAQQVGAPTSAARSAFNAEVYAVGREDRIAAAKPVLRPLVEALDKARDASVASGWAHAEEAVSEAARKAVEQAALRLGLDRFDRDDLVEELRHEA